MCMQNNYNYKCCGIRTDEKFIKQFLRTQEYADPCYKETSTKEHFEPFLKRTNQFFMLGSVPDSLVLLAKVNTFNLKLCIAKVSLIKAPLTANFM